MSHKVSKCLNQSKELRVQDIFVHTLIINRQEYCVIKRVGAR
jgi:hypothetical protein